MSTGASPNPCTPPGPPPLGERDVAARQRADVGDRELTAVGARNQTARDHEEANRHKYEQAMSQQALNNESLPPDERFAHLDEALLELKETDRNPLVLRFFEGRNFKEVGQALGATEEAARKRVSRALEALASRMKGRGVTACTVAGLTTMLTQASHAAPVQLLPAIATAARQTLSVIDAVGSMAVKVRAA